MRPTELARRAGRRANLWRKRKFIEQTTLQIQDKMDREQFDSQFLHYLDGNSSSRKFVLIDKWLRDAVVRYCAYGLDTSRGPLRVCDLGCGAGYFLMVCEHFGHQAVGLDLDCDLIFREMIEFFSLNRVVARIDPYEPLSNLGDAKYDVFTAFMTCFNRYSDGRPWMSEEWEYFLHDLRGRLNQGGRVIVKFNRNHNQGVLYPKEVRSTIEQLDFFRSRFYGDNLEMVAR